MDALAQLKTSLVGRYAIDREIGAGGMATVYLARDLKHNRPVALKVLNPELGAVLGVERFLSEIQVTANLQHPNLLPLFDSGEADGLLFYVMPYVEGESLRAKIYREKQLPIDEAIHIAAAVASALDYAHRHDVIHRDLKPENILLHDREPLVADFGIALAVSKAGGNRITQTGLSLGTPQYMSPEQATGDRAIDGRTDVYSLGAVLYEMLTGEPPHDGTTAQAIIAKVITDRPRGIRLSRDTVPPHVEAAVDRALAKLPADRFHSARDFADAITGSRPVSVPSQIVTPGSIERDVTLTLSFPVERIRRTTPWLIALVAATIAGWALLRPTPTKGHVSRFVLTLPDSFRLFVGAGPIEAISPDGSRLAIIGGFRGRQRAIFIRNIGDVELRQVRGTEDAQRPSFSPDGQWLAFQLNETLKKIPVDGGTAITVADTATAFSWGDNDMIVYAPALSRRPGLYRVSAAGGVSEQLTSPDTLRGETGHSWPLVLPGGDAVIFSIVSGDPALAELAVVTIKDKAIKRLGVLGSNARYLPNGYLAFGRVDGTALFAAKFDRRSLKIVGAVVPVLEDVTVKSGGATEVSVSSDGTLLQLQGAAGRQLALATTTGRLTAALQNDPKIFAFSPRFSPDGKRIAMAIRQNGGTDIWIYELGAHTTTRLTTDGFSAAPSWTADGKRVAYISGRGRKFTLLVRSWDGSGSADTLHVPTSVPRNIIFSPRGRLFVVPQGIAANTDFYAGSLDSVEKTWPLVATPANEQSPAISKDGRWLAYSSTETGANQVYVRALPGPGGRFQVSTDGGGEPLWAPDGRRLLYRTGTHMMAATLSLGEQAIVLRRDTLFEDVFAREGGRQAYDISPDGKTLVVGRLIGSDARMVIVVNWLDEMRDRMALATRK